MLAILKTAMSAYVLVPLGCASDAPSPRVLVLGGRVEILGIQSDGEPLDGQFTLTLSNDGRFHESITLGGGDRVDEMRFDGHRLFARSFLAYPRTPVIEVAEAETELWRETMEALRTATEPMTLNLSADVPVDAKSSPVGAGMPGVATATTTIQLTIEEVDLEGQEPIAKVWRRVLGGTRNVPYRSAATGGEARQVLAFQVDEVRWAERPDKKRIG